MIISENALNQDLIPKSNVGDSQRRSLQDLISDPVVDGGIDSGGNVPSDQQNNTIPVVTPTAGNTPTPTPTPPSDPTTPTAPSSGGGGTTTPVKDGNAGNVKTDKLNFRFTESLNIPYNASEFPKDFVASQSGIQSVVLIFNNATIRREEDA